MCFPARTAASRCSGWRKTGVAIITASTPLFASNSVSLAYAFASGTPAAKAYARDTELLAKSGVDAVIIATPVFLHPEHLEAAVRAGKHIYIEKPAGADVAGCLRLMRAADSADRKLD